MSARRPPQDHRRHVALLLTFLVMLGVVAGRLIFVQVVMAGSYSDRAMAQRLADIELSPRRGTIYDREGEPLAVSTEARTVYAAPNQIKDKRGTAAALASALGGSEQAYLKKLQGTSGFVYVARKIEPARADALKKLDLDGIGMVDDFRRLYPSGELACQVLGFVGQEGKGLEGMERQYESLLGGRPGVLLEERDPTNAPIPGGIRKEIAPQHGRDIVLTIDKDIQYEAQLQLAKAVKEWGAKSGSVIVMNPRDGQIYAMASVPGFNPNEFGKAKSGAIRNRPAADAYEPGSTLKGLTAAAVIEEGLYTPDTEFNLPSTIRVGGRTIHESHDRSAVRWSLTDIVTNSSNVGTVKLGLKLGEDRLYQGLKSFGLTERPGIDFPGAGTGWLPPTSEWSASSIGNIPFGQGVSLTPLQLSRAIGSLANDGVLTTPHLLLDVPGETGAVPTWPTRRAVSEKTAADVTGMLAQVVTVGTGKAAAVPGYTVAGKTGTAQKATPGRGYTAGKYIGSFIGYLPAEDPQVLISVTIDEPTNGIYGGSVAAPTFARLAQFAVSHLKVPPSTSSLEESATTPVKPGVGPVSDDAVRD